MTEQKKRIAIFGRAAQTIPSCRRLTEELSKTYDITVFAETYRPLQSALPSLYRFVTIPKGKVFKPFAKLILSAQFLYYHCIARFHIIHAHSTYPTGLVASRLKKIVQVPLIVSLDGEEATALEEISFGDLLKSGRKETNVKVLNSADAIVCLTKFAASEVAKNLSLSNPVNIIPRGIDLSLFRFRKKPIGKPLNILSVGYIDHVKDPDTLIKTFSLLNERIDAQLTHVGKDYLNGRVEQLIRQYKLKDKVKMLGFVEHEKLPSLFNEFDLFLFTSRFESQGIVLNEAMAVGLPIVGTRVGLLADLVGEGCCLTAEIGDVNALASTVLNLVKSNEQFEELRDKAYTWVKDHDVTWTAKRISEVYESILRSKNIS